MKQNPVYYASMCDGPKSFNSLSTEQQEILLNWIKENITEGYNYNTHWNSWELSKTFYWTIENPFPINNLVMKCAMQKCGFEPKSKKKVDWVYRIEINDRCKLSVFEMMEKYQKHL